MQEESSGGRNAARAEATQRALMDAARALFIEKGYADTGTPEIVKNANVTRGALYHHFDGKEGLLRAVLIREAKAISEEIRQSSTDTHAPHEALMTGARAYFVAMADPGRQRLMLRDGPAILGPKEMAVIDRQAGIGGLADGLAAVMGEAAPSPATLDALSEILSAGFDRAAQLDAGQDDALAAFELLFLALAAHSAAKLG